MTAPRSFTLRPLAVAAIAGVLALGGTLWWVAERHQAAEAALERLEPRHARLVGLEGSAAELDRALAARRALLDRHAYPAAFDAARAGSDAQQRARELFTRAGLQVGSTQVLPAKPVEGFERIPLQLAMEGDFAALHSALVVLGSQSPALNVEGFTAYAVQSGRPEAAPRLSIQVTLYVLRVRP